MHKQKPIEEYECAECTRVMPGVINLKEFRERVRYRRFVASCIIVTALVAIAFAIMAVIL